MKMQFSWYPVMICQQLGLKQETTSTEKCGSQLKLDAVSQRSQQHTKVLKFFLTQQAWLPRP